MTRQAALIAQTDRTLAHIREFRRKGGWRVDQLAPSSMAVADAIREEFGSDAALAGRVLASASPQLAHIVNTLAKNRADKELTLVLVDMLGLAAEELCRDAAVTS